MKSDVRKNIFLILVGKRRESAIEVQKVLTEFGCLIKTRLGVHESSDKICSEAGLIFLEIVGKDTEIEEFAEKLEIIENVNVKHITMSLDD